MPEVCLQNAWCLWSWSTLMAVGWSAIPIAVIITWWREDDAD